MEISLDDLFKESEPNKPKYKTFAFTESDDQLIETAKKLWGKKRVAEIIRRSARAGIAKALEKYGDKSA